MQTVFVGNDNEDHGLVCLLICYKSERVYLKWTNKTETEGQGKSDLNIKMQLTEVCTNLHIKGDKKHNTSRKNSTKEVKANLI